MKLSLLLLFLFTVCIAFIEGSELNKSPNRIKTSHEEEKLMKEPSKDHKNILRYLVTIDSRTARCSLKKCAHQDLTCLSYQQERQMSENSKTNTKREGAKRGAKCSNPKNPLCIHDIWVGGKREESQVASDGQSPLTPKIECTLCNPEDEDCLFTIKMVEGISKRSLGHGMEKTNTGPEEFLATSSSNANPASYSSRPTPDCDFIRDANCNRERRFEARTRDRGITLQKFQTKPKLPTTSSKKKCRGRPNKICRWRPQPIKERRQEQVSDSYSTSRLRSSSQDNTKYAKNES